VSRPRKATRPREKPAPPRENSRKPLPEALARDAVAHEEVAAGPGDRVRMTFRVVLPRPVAETLVARAIREEKNIGMLVTEILEVAARKGSL
jgi:hypothetical protein